jgi:WD40 repeat protein
VIVQHFSLLFFAGSEDMTIRIWDVSTHEQVALLIGHEKTVLSVAFNRNGKRLASGEKKQAWTVALHGYNLGDCNNNNHDYNDAVVDDDVDNNDDNDDDDDDDYDEDDDHERMFL